MAVAERLRRSVRERFAGHPATVSVSVGVATIGPQVQTAGALMRAANRALYAAKHLGRDRSVAYHASRSRCSTRCREVDGAAREQLAAAMLLAETLDLRDVGTARHSETVGRYAEEIARELGWDVRARPAHPRGRDPARHRQARHRRRDPPQGRPARRARVGRDAPPSRARRADPRAREPARHRRLGARAPRADRRRAATRAGSPATRSRRRRGSWPSPTPTRR